MLWTVHTAAWTKYIIKLIKSLWKAESALLPAENLNIAEEETKYPRGKGVDSEDALARRAGNTLPTTGQRILRGNHQPAIFLACF